MTDLSPTLQLTHDLISLPSVTPFDAGCQGIIKELLTECGFQVAELPNGEVSNLWAQYGSQAPLFVFAGHTDVVPTGPLEQWDSDPFMPTIRDGYLYGRGAADMKSGLSAMLMAAKDFIQQHPNFAGSIGFLITSAEEGPAFEGTPKVLEYLSSQGIQIDYAIVGEASSSGSVGDTIKIGRRGSLTGDFTIHGRQGHIAYPHLADNPIHNLAPVLDTLCKHEWDQGNDYFQPTSFQISNIHAGTGAGNVIPGELNLRFNIRYSPEITAEKLQKTIESVFQQNKVDYQAQWTHFAKPFLTQPGKLTTLVNQVIAQHCGHAAKLSTTGGTSDARYIAEDSHTQVIELGPCNATIHKINECVNVTELDKLKDIYQDILRQLFS